jgi:hypothetical protein
MAVERRLLPDGKRLVVQADGVTIKIEVSPVLRGTVFPPTVRSVSPAVEDRFGFAEMQLVSEADLYAGKIAAALDRQHPRDLFDIHFLFANEGISDDLFKAFLIYLVSHPRPAHELLCPHRLDIRDQYGAEFLGMTVTDLPLEALLDARAADQRTWRTGATACQQAVPHVLPRTRTRLGSGRARSGDCRTARAAVESDQSRAFAAREPR